MCEQSDFGSGTSSASTKLIHGGLRYLETLQFRLVREALAERDVQLRAAPHLIRPRRFVLPHHLGLRPRWVLRLGLLIYDRLGGKTKLPPAKSVDLKADPAGLPLRSRYRSAFEYSDCCVDDSRLVILNALDARIRGASMNPRTRCTAAERQSDKWLLTLEEKATSAVSQISARVLVNAAGPWVNQVSRDVVHAKEGKTVRLDKGSHIVVPRLFEHDRAYVFQNADGRIVFAIPYEHDFTLIGTTEQDYHGDPASAAIEESEADYLCRTVSEYFREPVCRQAIVWSYSGVRALWGEAGSKAQELSRDYLLELALANGKAPLLTVYGGKITTYRRLAEAALARLAAHLKIGVPWTAGAILPGGDAPDGKMSAIVEWISRAYPFLARNHIERLVAAYGTRATLILKDVRYAGDMGHRFGCDLTEAEVRYMVAVEWAQTTADVLRRRSKLGLRFSPSEVSELENWMNSARSFHSGTMPNATERS